MMKTYQLKPETIEMLRTRRARMLGSAGAIYWESKNNRTGDTLKRPIWAYYSKPRYSLRTSKVWSGTWSLENPGAYNCTEWIGRDLGDAHDQLDGWNQATGYYADNWQDSVIKGRVLQLPARNGEPQYIPGVYCDGWDGLTMYPLDVYDCPKEAARAADGHAELYAEDCREYDAKDAAEQQIEDSHESARELIAEFHTLKNEIKGNQYTPAVCDVIKHKMLEMREEVTRHVKRAVELRADYWSAVE